MRRNIRRAIQASIPPTPHRIINASTVPRSSAAVTVGIGTSLDAALARLDLDFGSRMLLITDRRATGFPGPRATCSVATALVRSGAVTLGVAPERSTTEARRWHALAQRSGAELTELGSAGWNRVVFGDRSLVLEHADLPAELHRDATIVALSAPVDAGAIALWTGNVHPNTALRARVAPNAAVELSAAVDARYMLVGLIGSSWLAVVATPAICAELVARGIDCLRRRERGFETAGPWEDAGVQHLSGLESPGLAASGLVLRVRVEDNADASLVQPLSEMLGWQLEFVDDELGGTGGAG